MAICGGWWNFVDYGGIRAMRRLRHQGTRRVNAQITGNRVIADLAIGPGLTKIARYARLASKLPTRFHGPKEHALPKLNKLPDEEVAAMLARRRRRGAGRRAELRRQYRAYLSQFAVGDWVVVELEEGENRATVKVRLARAAAELGYRLTFLRTRGAMRFCIEAA
jgi:hypothetical protein